MARVSCPFCGEPIDVWVDTGGGEQQEYIEDCSVCCRPIRFVVRRAAALDSTEPEPDGWDRDDGEFSIEAHRE
jgi:hypothetical protein